ncbi:hypothetical protein MBLNU457_4795t2 [Dothideomycetes sp. NU457]
MLKRKFSLGLKDKLLSSKTSSIPVDVDPDFSPPPSPYPGKRDDLSQRTVFELRNACASIVNNLIPSDHNLGNTDEIRAQLDYAAIKSSFPAVPTNINNGRRATVSEVPDFPLPTPLHKHKSLYTYKPDTSLKSLFPDPINPSQNSRQRAENLFASDGPLAGKRFTRPLSQNFTLNSNVPSLEAFPRPWQVQRGQSYGTDKSTPGTDTAEDPWDASTPATSLGLTPGHSKQPSKQNDNIPEGRQTSVSSAHPDRQESASSALPAMPVRQPSMVFERGRTHQMRHVPSSASIANQHRAGSRSQSHTRGRARSITRSIKDYMRPGSSNEDEQHIRTPSTARAPSVRAPSVRAPSVRAPSVRAPSVRAPSASAPVVRMPSADTSGDRAPSLQPPSEHASGAALSRPVTRSKSKTSMRSRDSSTAAAPDRNKFSWKSWRNSWQPWKTSSESVIASTDDSGRDAPAEPTVNLNRELPPLPGLDQWKDSEPVQAPEKEQEPEPEKPKHIATLLKRRSGDLTKRISGDFSKFKHELNKRRSQDMSKWKVDWRKSREISDPPVFETSQPFVPVDEDIDVAESTEAPLVQVPSMTPATAVPSGSPKFTRKPAPAPIKTQSTPTDSVMGDQERNSSTGKSTVEVRMPSGYVSAHAPLGPLTSSPLTASEMERMVVPMSKSKSPQPSSDYTTSAKKRPSKLDLGRHTSPRLYSRESDRGNGATNFVSTDVEVENYDRAKAVSNKYRYADEISSLQSPPPVPPKDKPLRWLRKSKSRKQMTWMDEMEKLGVKDGLLLTDNLQGSPIVRY